MSKPPRVTRVPACSYSRCPRPTDPDFHRCPVCQSATQDHHHVKPRGMGGSKSRDSKENIIALCRIHHEKLTKHEATDMIVDLPWRRSYVYLDKRGIQLCDQELEAGSAAAEESHASQEPPLTASAAAPPASGGAGEASGVGGESLTSSLPGPSPALSVLTEDWSQVSDDELEVKFRTADQMQGMAFLIKCKVVQAYRENHVQAWGESWTEQAIERFGQSRRTCEAYANIWQICATSDAFSTEDIGPLTDSRGLMQYIGRQDPEAGAEAMQAAVAHLAEYGEPPTVAALAGEGKPRVRRWSFQELEDHLCHTCRAVVSMMEGT